MDSTSFLSFFFIGLGKGCRCFAEKLDRLATKAGYGAMCLPAIRVLAAVLFLCATASGQICGWTSPLYGCAVDGPLTGVIEESIWRIILGLVDAAILLAGAASLIFGWLTLPGNRGV